MRSYAGCLGHRFLNRCKTKSWRRCWRSFVREANLQHSPTGRVSSCPPDDGFQSDFIARFKASKEATRFGETCHQRSSIAAFVSVRLMELDQVSVYLFSCSRSWASLISGANSVLLPYRSIKLYQIFLASTRRDSFCSLSALSN